MRHHSTGLYLFKMLGGPRIKCLQQRPFGQFPNEHHHCHGGVGIQWPKMHCGLVRSEGGFRKILLHIQDLATQTMCIAQIRTQLDRMVQTLFRFSISLQIRIYLGNVAEQLDIVAILSERLLQILQTGLILHGPGQRQTVFDAHFGREFGPFNPWAEQFQHVAIGKLHPFGRGQQGDDQRVVGCRLIAPGRTDQHPAQGVQMRLGPFRLTEIQRQLRGIEPDIRLGTGVIARH